MGILKDTYDEALRCRVEGRLPGGGRLTVGQMASHQWRGWAMGVLLADGRRIELPVVSAHDDHVVLDSSGAAGFGARLRVAERHAAAAWAAWPPAGGGEAGEAAVVAGPDRAPGPGEPAGGPDEEERGGAPARARRGHYTLESSTDLELDTMVGDMGFPDTEIAAVHPEEAYWGSPVSRREGDCFPASWSNWPVVTRGRANLVAAARLAAAHSPTDVARVAPLEGAPPEPGWAAAAPAPEGWWPAPAAMPPAMRLVEPGGAPLAVPFGTGGLAWVHPEGVGLGGGWPRLAAQRALTEELVREACSRSPRGRALVWGPAEDADAVYYLFGAGVPR